MPRPTAEREIASLFELQPLERRLFLSDTPLPVVSIPLRAAGAASVTGATPAAVIPASVTPGSLLNQTVRQNIVSRLSAGGLKNTLAPLVSSASAFDAALLDHMRRKTTGRFFFGPDSVDAVTSYVTANGMQGSAQARADELLLHEFPLQGDASSYDVQLPNAIDWDNTGYSSHGEFLPGLNRFEYWRNLGEAFRYTGDTDYVQEIVNQLASWSQQNPALADPTKWQTLGGVGWNLLSAGIRAEAWAWTYALVLDSSAWSKEANTLFVSRMFDHGDLLYKARTDSGHGYELTSNRSLFHAKGLLVTGQLFADYAAAAAWETAARKQVVDAMNGQLFDDGSHFEQSPGYASNVLSDLLEAKWLDEVNGDAGKWPAAAEAKIASAIEAHRQILHPDGSRPAIGDTYRGGASNVFFKAAYVQDPDLLASSTVDDAGAAGRDGNYTSLVVADASAFSVGDQVQLANRSELMLVTAVDLGADTLTVQRRHGGTSTSAWADGVTVYNFGDRPINRPRTRDVWIFGPSTVEPFMELPAAGVLGDRGNAYPMSDSGNYVFRSGEDDEDARQIVFDAGPTGGSAHGHYDLLNFELYGHGRVLISDPGLYLYGQSSARSYVLSTPAHNTISVGGKSHARLDGASNPSIVVDQYDVTYSSAQITAHHHGYQYVDGRPVVSRSVWYDLDGTMLIVDWGEGNVAQTYTQSFNLPTEGDNTNVSPVQADLSIKTRHGSGGNVRIAPVSRPGQTAGRSLKFVSNGPGDDGDYMEDAYRYQVSQTGKFVVFVTLITAYDGTTTPDTTASLLTTTPQPGEPIQVELMKGGTPQTITFTPPALTRPAKPNLNEPRGGANDIAWDAQGRLHMVWHDRVDTSLKYSVRDASGNWSIAETIDNGPNAGGGHLSLALDSKGLPGVAYFDGTSGDLEYAKYRDNAWVRETVDAKGSVGLNPSLAFSRKDGPMISYYHKTRGDLRLAVSGGGGWIISTIDHAGNVGRWSSMQLDPNRPDASKVAILYEDSDAGDYKYAVQGSFGGAESQSNAGFSLYRIDNLARGGGHTSLAFFDSKASHSQRWRPAASYYDGTTLSLRYAYMDDAGWHASTVAAGQRRGWYSSLVFDSVGTPNVFYWNRNADSAWRAKGGPGKWTFTSLGAGGRSMQVARSSTGAFAYTNQNNAAGHLSVQYLGS